MNFVWISTGIHIKTCKISKNPYFQLNYKQSQSKGEAFALPLTEQCRKIFEGFSVKYRAEKCHFWRIQSNFGFSQRLLAVCTTVVQLGILLLNRRKRHGYYINNSSETAVINYWNFHSI